MTGSVMVVPFQSRFSSCDTILGNDMSLVGRLVFFFGV